MRDSVTWCFALGNKIYLYISLATNKPQFHLVSNYQVSESMSQRKMLKSTILKDMQLQQFQMKGTRQIKGQVSSARNLEKGRKKEEFKNQN